MALETLKGALERVVYENPDNGYLIARFLPSASQDELVTIVGNLAAVSPGELLELQGWWSVHPKYGRQFEVKEFKTVLPATVAGIQKYLGSGLIKGIGPVMAERITQHFDLETLQVIDETPQRLIEVDGIGEVRVQRIIQAWQEQKDIRELMFFLKDHEVSTSYAVKIFKTYGKEALKVVQANPYQLAEDIFGIGFKTADKIAMKLGMAKDAPARMEAALTHTLSQATDDGHIYLPQDELIARCAQALENPEAHPSLNQALERLTQRKMVMREAAADDQGKLGDAVFLTALYYAEVGVSHGVKRLQAAPVRAHAKQVENLMAQLRKTVSYSDEQETAIQAALMSKVMILTGGPGTGKTTTVKGILFILERLAWKTLLAAPTGRAAKKLSEATGRQAKTIHRLLGFQPPKGIDFNEAHPLEADAVIVDEVSMVDLVLMNNLLKAIPSAAHLILVGDVDQLPSVGAGNVLRDLMDSGQIQVTRLTQIFRQAQQSRIVINAHRINSGQAPLLKAAAKDNFFFLEEEDLEQAAALIAQLVCERLPKFYGLDPLDDIQVLTPMYRGAIGADQLNRLLQEKLNPKEAFSLPFTSRRFRLGDKVMQIINNYEKDVFNGDIGKIAKVDTDNQQVLVEFPDQGLVPYEAADLNELVLAYAITIHKSQGSEYRAVVMPLHTHHYVMLQRNLLYTGITRAKELAVLVGNKKALRIAVNNNKQQKRYTQLAARLKETLAAGLSKREQD